MFLGRIGRAAMPRLNAILPSLMPLAIAAAGIISATLVAQLTGPASPWPFWIGLAGVALAVLEAAYIEWDRWAPRSTPQLDVQYESSDDRVSILVTNRDAAATFRASVTGIAGEGGGALPASVLDPEGFPWELGWGSDGQRDAWIARGDSARLSVVSFDNQAAAQLFAGHRRQQGNPYIFVFPGPAGEHYLDEIKPEDDHAFLVHVRIVRTTPEGFVDRSVYLRFPQHPIIWQHMYVPGG